MRITRLYIENFRSIRKLDIALGETTVFIGPNNVGKSAILEALRTVLTRQWNQGRGGFTEYDVHVRSDDDDPKESPGIVIEIVAEEVEAGEWTEAVGQELDRVMNSDPVSGKDSISLRVKCAWNARTGALATSWHFLNEQGKPLSEASAHRSNLDQFWRYLPVFRLGALRDAKDEFSPRSQFWGQLLRAIKIPSQLESRVQRVLGLLNRRLLKADPKLSRISETVAQATKIAARNEKGDVDLSLVPLKSWDLLSKAGIALRNDSESPVLPLQQHGQGVQSLSVVFLFRAFVEHLLAESYRVDSTPVLVLEEPETHLHPQAARSLWKHLHQLPGQKVVTTHSPYFVQHVPFRNLRMVRLTDEGTEIRWLPATFSASGIPSVEGLERIVNGSRGLLEHNRLTGVLTAKGRVDESTFSKLQHCFTDHDNVDEISTALEELRNESVLYMADDELRKLETWARRMRGEVFFAEKWMIVEGQSDYLIVEALAQALDYDLDEHGVTLIDAKNGGDPFSFVVLARALSIPWIAVLDRDVEGNKVLERLRKRGFDPEELRRRYRMHEAGSLEKQLVKDLGRELGPLARECGVDPNLEGSSLAKELHREWARLSALLAERVRNDRSFTQYLPPAFRAAINDLRELT